MYKQEHMSCWRWQRSVQLPRTPGCHRNTNSSAILSKYGKCTSIGIGYCHIHIRIATPSSAFEFVFRWHASYTLLRHLRRLIRSCYDYANRPRPTLECSIHVCCMPTCIYHIEVSMIGVLYTWSACNKATTLPVSIMPCIHSYPNWILVKLARGKLYCFTLLRSNIND